MTNEEFEAALFDPKSSILNDHYLGYIVVKPLPNSVIGPSLLKTYEVREDETKRYYPGCRSYDVNLFGRTLQLDSLVYQEQDSVVAACASVAIWSAFHKTSLIFNTNLPSPSEITKSAGNSFINYGRTFPNPGLDITQICRAIASTGLVSELLISKHFLSDTRLARRLVYAYNRAGLPVLLFLQFNKELGHLITINGYSDNSDEREPKPGIQLWADTISKFYAHDDQVGPFAKMSFPEGDNIQTPWWDDDDNPIDAKIHSMIIPVYPKIRIMFIDVFDRVDRINEILEENLFSVRLEWDLYLSESNNFKEETLANVELHSEVKRRVGFESYPRYIWVAKATVNGIDLFDFIFDSTDSATGHFCIDFILYFKENTFKEFLKDNLETYRQIYVDHRGGPKLGKKIYDKIITVLSS